MNSLRIETTGRADCRVWAGDAQLAEIRDLRLTALRLEAGAPLLIGAEVPLPLYWQQYADHENPERNASSNGIVSIEQGSARNAPLQGRGYRSLSPAGGAGLSPSGRGGDESAHILCSGTNASGAIRSTYRLAFHESRTGVYELAVHALLEVTGEQGWLITPNPHHGELEFCNVWPIGTFSVVPGERKMYTVIAVRRGEEITLVRHTHLESPDKHGIGLHRGDRIAWLLEDRNPVITLESDMPASGGLCAYMWDVHVGYPVCDSGEPRVLPRGFTREARFRLSSMPRSEGERWLSKGKSTVSPDDDRWPVYVAGLNTFRRTFASAAGEAHIQWPWTFEVVDGPAGSVRGELDRSVGYDDDASLYIRSTAGGSGRWTATTLGPAFGGAAFRPGRRYRLSARVRIADLDGEAGVALRVHRTGEPDLHHPERYHEFLSAGAGPGTTGWKELAVLTPPISPEPDRMHILLLHRGKGESWFDNVLLEEHD